MSGPAILPPMTCRKCGASNPVIFLAPVIVTGSGTCICLDCAEAREWLDPDGNLKAGIEL
ncbi:hypothetical protein SAMN04488527_11057 [Aliiroseovarius crassostreae]|uniref:ClpX-type ZB domain-containing protein n=1 Tax=Aliiroseovarius crassostreae TaxID=154981 RepID=A0A0P7I248_9RHOB|nr:hypothetical protein [Aliiroseovarius crassostreae]KPN63038.1 hypothetical protein AKJ29_02500 [Aliiroseovarius crassostreae]SFU67474.1 hypothetical protein SAMN04488527_11057 [Aliiroseovarius crassostreae]